jgi:hypothetical protein
MKKCNKCGQIFDLDFFWKDKTKKDGHHTICKKCANMAKKIYYNTEIGKKKHHAWGTSEKARIRGREYDNSERRKQLRKEWKKTEVYKANRKKHNSRIRYIGRGKVYDLVKFAKRKGILIAEPCVICGAMPTVGHHEDYNKPLEVIWLCNTHHNRLHKNMLDKKLLQKKEANA